MLPRHSRLPGGEAFSHVFRGGKPFFLGEVLLLTAEQEEKKSRIGVAFKGKNFPKSSLRHAYKRRLLSALEPFLTELPQGKKIVFLYQRPYPTETFAAFEKTARTAVKSLQKAKNNL